MDALPKSRLLRFVERAMVLARRAVARFSSRYSRKWLTLRQHVVLLCLKVKKTSTYRDLYHRRNMNETANAAINQKFGAFVRSCRWWKQFRELVIKCIVHNLERSIAIAHEKDKCPCFREERTAE